MLALALTFIVSKFGEALFLNASPSRWDMSSYLIYHGDRFIERLFTWDNLYYFNVANRGVQYEQEYAFSPIWALIVRTLASVIPGRTGLASIALCGALLSVCSHFLACVILTRSGPSLRATTKTAYIAGFAYVLCPAGVFLSTGYPESTFAALSFLGVNLFYRDHYITSGMVFACTGLIRSNGLLWGILFAVKLALVIKIALGRKGSQSNKDFVVICTRLILGGSLVGFGLAGPQFYYWKTLCPGQPWCQNTIPILYTHVQEHYWNNGFMRYWTPNNIPNFIFGAPTLVLLYRSRNFAPIELRFVQIAMLVGALFFWHVQIITRVASCMPAPYLYIASLLEHQKREGKAWLCYFTVWVYVQAILFGAFLPPA